MNNPFQYGGVVSGQAFCNRQKETADIVRAIENHEKLFVFSERRFGKTSLVQAVVSRLPKQRFICAYVDLWPTDGPTTFLAAVAKAIAESMSTSAEKLLRTAREFFGRLIPSVTVDDEGKPVLRFAVGNNAKPGPELEEVLEAPARLAAKGQQNVVVVFDEFQHILEYETDLVERQLRSVIQKQKEVAYIFLGSRKHLIQKMIMDGTRPLYRAGGHYPLGPIGETHWLPFIRKRFIRADKMISDDRIRAICRLTQGHPFYTQHLCHTLWEISAKGQAITEQLAQTAVNILLDRENYAYTTLWESLGLSQQRFLQGLASGPADIKPFSSDFLQHCGLRTASNAQRAVAALLEKDIIDRDNGSFVISDRFFRLWILRTARGPRSPGEWGHSHPSLNC